MAYNNVLAQHSFEIVPDSFAFHGWLFLLHHNNFSNNIGISTSSLYVILCVFHFRWLRCLRQLQLYLLDG